MVDIREYKELAREAGAFKDMELDLLAETLIAWKEMPGDPYVLLDLRDGKMLAGFALFCKTPNTDFTFDIRALCIDKAYIGKGVAPRLLEMLEEETLRLQNSAILRSEISRKKEDALGRGLYVSCGYACIGHIQDFYAEGDDLFIFAKFVHKPYPEEKKSQGPNVDPAALVGEDLAGPPPSSAGAQASATDSAPSDAPVPNGTPAPPKEERR